MDNRGIKVSEAIRLLVIATGSWAEEGSIHYSRTCEMIWKIWTRVFGADRIAHHRYGAGTVARNAVEISLPYLEGQPRSMTPGDDDLEWEKGIENSLIYACKAHALQQQPKAESQVKPEPQAKPKNVATAVSRPEWLPDQFKTYADYLKSRTWTTFASQMKRLRNNRCERVLSDGEMCSMTKAKWMEYQLDHPMMGMDGRRRSDLEVHHKRYVDENNISILCRETPADVLVLCPKHHDEADREREAEAQQVDEEDGEVFN